MKGFALFASLMVLLRAHLGSCVALSRVLDA